MNHAVKPAYRALRHKLVLVALLGVFALLAARAVFLQVVDAGYLQEQGNARHLRVVEDNSHRGMILDRNGEPLAISTPVDSLWANPEELSGAHARWPVLARQLGVPVREIGQQVRRNKGREFMYLKRHVTPEMAQQVMALDVPGVAVQREYRRFYPAGAVAGHVVGFTNVDDQGQEGLELAYNSWLRATPGKKRVLKDRLGNVVETVESISLPLAGRDLNISIDRRIQYLAYRELKAAVAEHKAQAASAVVLDARSGEILAMVNEPGFNPNNRNNLRSQVFRNRAVTDVFEPGSTLKAFTVAAALESGKFSPGTPIDTAPGNIQVGRNTIRDTHNYGLLTVAGVIEKSSNVGATKIAFALNKNSLWRMFTKVGFGSVTKVGLPGESAGVVNPASGWSPIEQATASFGYGISVTALQLAHAYSGLANNGVVVPLTLLRRDQPVEGVRVMSGKTARQVGAMLEMAVGADGTGTAAQVYHYRVAGKTGTVRKLSGGNYSANNYLALFAGFAPASDPRLVMVIMVDDPTGSVYYGGQIAAPVFGKVMSGALRLLNITPDDLERSTQRMVQAGSVRNAL
jgi:cell division protein FtsI (penicillin-binding protein 3)